MLTLFFRRYDDGLKCQRCIAYRFQTNLAQTIEISNLKQRSDHWKSLPQYFLLLLRQSIVEAKFARTSRKSRYTVECNVSLWIFILKFTQSISATRSSVFGVLPLCKTYNKFWNCLRLAFLSREGYGAAIYKTLLTMASYLLVTYPIFLHYPATLTSSETSNWLCHLRLRCSTPQIQINQTMHVVITQCGGCRVIALTSRENVASAATASSTGTPIIVANSLWASLAELLFTPMAINVRR